MGILCALEKSGSDFCKLCDRTRRKVIRAVTTHT